MTNIKATTKTDTIDSRTNDKTAPNTTTMTMYNTQMSTNTYTNSTSMTNDWGDH